MVDMALREIPKIYIDQALQLLVTRHDVDILEIGCMRAPLNHDPERATCPSCCDGHSTYLFAKTELSVISVDLNIEIAKSTCENFSNVKFIQKDAIQFAKEFRVCNPPLSIGLLFLDAWDVDNPESAGNHLEFYEIIKAGLNDDCMILIDDTDLYYDFVNHEYFHDENGTSGKGALLIPKLVHDGYTIILKGRQTLLCRIVK